ncbi:copper transpport protein [Basidiobolus ranarum]|uniref:Copper transport protein n=1 Tax=Basidiobolus ranarum TaxID=34480 RepID=A0ABR2WDM7_9FUNG
MDHSGHDMGGMTMPMPSSGGGGGGSGLALPPLNPLDPMYNGGMSRGSSGVTPSGGSGGGNPLNPSPLPPAACAMNMVFTWDYSNMCLVFDNWQVRSSGGLVAACIVTFAIAVAYELIRWGIRVTDRRIFKNEKALKDSSHKNGFFVYTVPWVKQILRALLYAIQVLISFFLMLIIMSYNGYIMFSLVLGAFVGFLLFCRDGIHGSQSAGCH